MSLVTAKYKAKCLKCGFIFYFSQKRKISECPVFGEIAKIEKV